MVLHLPLVKTFNILVENKICKQEYQLSHTQRPYIVTGGWVRHELLLGGYLCCIVTRCAEIKYYVYIFLFFLVIYFFMYRVYYRLREFHFCRGIEDFSKTIFFYILSTLHNNIYNCLTNSKLCCLYKHDKCVMIFGTIKLLGTLQHWERLKKWQEIEGLM